MSSRLALVGILCAACGRIGFDGTGTGTGTDGATPPSAGWIAISVGENTHACALREDRSLWCWGTNELGQLGDGTRNARTTPTRVGTDRDWATIDAGRDASCATKLDGSLWCWGGNTFDSPVRVGADSDWTVVTVAGHACALKTNRSLWCWGENGDGQVGDGTNTDRSAPVQVGAETDWAVVKVGGVRTCGIKTDGSLWCWGGNPIGDGNAAARNIPTRIGTDTWVTADLGGAHTCAGKTDGSVWCWGYGYFGQVGDTQLPVGYNVLAPSRVGPDTNWTELSLGGLHSCGLRADGSAWCWGIDYWGELVDGNSMFGSSVPAHAGVGSVFTTIAAGGYGTCAIQAPDGVLVCAGASVTLGDGSFGLRATPGRVGAMTGWTAIRSGYAHACAQRGSELWCWGDGPVGDGAKLERPRFSQVGASTVWQSVASGGGQTCGIASDRSLWCWGSGPIEARSPQRIGTDTDWSEIAAGVNYSCAIKVSGLLWCWGANDVGQVGDGTTMNRAAPVLIGGTWLHVACGEDHTCGVQSDGSMWCWGANGHGELGIGSKVDQHAAAPVGMATSWTQVTAGNFRSCGLRADNSLWCWGEARIPTSDPTVPTQVGTALDWTSVVAGRGHICGIRAGALWCWGDNGRGMLGDGTVIDRNMPTQTGTETDWVEVAPGEMHTCGRKTDGSIWCWGWNESGQLGDGRAWRTTFASVLGP